MVAPSIERQTTRLAGILGKMPTVVERRMFNALRQVGDAHLAEMRLRLRADSASGIRTRSGALRQSFGKRIERTGETSGLRMFLFSAGVPYAEIHEFGGTITPKNVTFLTIPLEDNLTPAGVPRFPSAKALRDDPAHKTFVFKGPRTGNLFIVEKQGDDLKFLWRLARMATIPARLGWRATWKALGPERRRIYEAALNGTANEARS